MISHFLCFFLLPNFQLGKFSCFFQGIFKLEAVFKIYLWLGEGHIIEVYGPSTMSQLTPQQVEVAKKYDVSGKLVEFLDRHLFCQVLDSLVKIYGEEKIDQLEMQVLKDTYMFDVLKELHANLKGDAKELAEINEREQKVHERLIPLNESTKKTLSTLCSKEIQDNLKQDKASNRELIKGYGIDDSKIMELYEFGKLQYNRGDYVMSSDLLNNFKLLSSDSEKILSATCGKFVSDILSGDIIEAKNEMNNLREVTDNRNYEGSPLEQVKLRNWLIYNSLFLFFNSNKNSTQDQLANQLLQLNEIFISSSYLSTIEASCPWILRYIISSVLYTRDYRRLKDLIKAVNIESYEFQDPFTQLIDTLFIKFNLDNISETVSNIEILLETDFFLSKLDKALMMKNIYTLVVKNVLKIYGELDIEQLKVHFLPNLSQDIINEISGDFSNNNGKLSLKGEKESKYFDIYERTKALSFKSTQLLNNAFGKDF